MSMNIYMIAFQYDWDADTELLPDGGFFKSEEDASKGIKAVVAQKNAELMTDALNDYEAVHAEWKQDYARWQVLFDQGLASKVAPNEFTTDYFVKNTFQVTEGNFSIVKITPGVVPE